MSGGMIQGPAGADSIPATYNPATDGRLMTPADVADKADALLKAFQERLKRDAWRRKVGLPVDLVEERP